MAFATLNICSGDCGSGRRHAGMNSAAVNARARFFGSRLMFASSAICEAASRSIRSGPRVPACRS